MPTLMQISLVDTILQALQSGQFADIRPVVLQVIQFDVAEQKIAGTADSVIAKNILQDYAGIIGALADGAMTAHVLDNQVIDMQRKGRTPGYAKVRER